VARPRTLLPADSPGADVGQLLADMRGGDASAIQRLVPIVYDELKRIARAQRRAWADADTLNTTALVHELYVKLVRGREPDWRDRAHFLAVAAMAMRSILVDHARSRGTAKRGGHRSSVDLARIDAVVGAGALAACGHTGRHQGPPRSDRRRWMRKRPAVSLGNGGVRRPKPEVVLGAQRRTGANPSVAPVVERDVPGWIRGSAGCGNQAFARLARHCKFVGKHWDNRLFARCRRRSDEARARGRLSRNAQSEQL